MTFLLILAFLPLPGLYLPKVKDKEVDNIIREDIDATTDEYKRAASEEGLPDESPELEKKLSIALKRA